MAIQVHEDNWIVYKRFDPEHRHAVIMTNSNFHSTYAEFVTESEEVKKLIEMTNELEARAAKYCKALQLAGFADQNGILFSDIETAVRE